MRQLAAPRGRHRDVDFEEARTTRPLPSCVNHAAAPRTRRNRIVVAAGPHRPYRNKMAGRDVASMRGRRGQQDLDPKLALKESDKASPIFDGVEPRAFARCSANGIHSTA